MLALQGMAEGRNGGYRHRVHRKDSAGHLNHIAGAHRSIERRQNVVGPSGYPQGRVAEELSPADLIGRGIRVLSGEPAGCQAHGSGSDHRTNSSMSRASPSGIAGSMCQLSTRRGYTRSTSWLNQLGLTGGSSTTTASAWPRTS